MIIDTAYIQEDKKYIFERITVRMIGRQPYYEIEYVENGEWKKGYASFSLDIISSYIRQYFILQNEFEDKKKAAETHKKMEMLIEALKTGNITINNVPISDELIRREDALDILDQFEDSVENGESGFYEIARCMMQNLDAEDPEKPRMKMISREVKDTLVKRLMPMCTWNGMPKEAVNRLMEITRYVINLE